MLDPFWMYIFLCTSAFFAGVMNAVAGGGTLLTFPALTSVVSAAVANGTSTVALVPGSIAGAFAFRKEVAASRRFILRMLLPSICGGFLGTWFVIEDEKRFEHLVPWLILTAALLFLIQQPISRWMRSRRPPSHEPGLGMQLALMGFQFVIAVYGGYFGAGIGILMLTTLAFMGVGDIHHMNGVKTFLAFAINGSAVIVFAAYDRVQWDLAWPMAIAAIAGGYVGGSVSRRLPAKYVRWAVIAIGFGLSAYYFLRQHA